MKILESSENYLETIHILQKTKGYVRAVDIANELGFTKASVSVAMKHLKENEYIFVEPNNNICLLPKGLEIAERVYERHIIISTVLKSMGVSDETASEDACKIEHIISEETLNSLKAYINKL